MRVHCWFSGCTAADRLGELPFAAVDGKLLPAAAGPQSALCAARPQLKAVDKGRVVCDKVAFKGTISCRSLQHAVPQEGGRRERRKARGTCSSLAPDLIICIPCTHSEPGQKPKGFSIFLKWVAFFLPCQLLK